MIPFFKALCMSLILAALIGCKRSDTTPSQDSAQDFSDLYLSAQNAYENRNAEQAVSMFRQALDDRPTSTGTRLALANALLLADQSEAAINACDQVLEKEPDSAAALYVKGSAHLRLRQFEPALMALQQSTFIDPSVAAAHFQLGNAHQGLDQVKEAVAAFRETVRLDTSHPSAHYVLAQALLRNKEADQAQEHLAIHKEILAARNNSPIDVAGIERCRLTEIPPLPGPTQQPDPEGIEVAFADATAEFFKQATYHGPAAIADSGEEGYYHLVALSPKGLVLLENDGSSFEVRGDALPVAEGQQFHHALAADLDNDKLEDALFVGSPGTRLIRIIPGEGLGIVESALDKTSADFATVADLDFTGKLSLILSTPSGLEAWRNQGKLSFSRLPTGTALPATPGPTGRIISDDWNLDDLPDIFVARPGQPPQLYLNRHGGPLDQATTENWPTGSTIEVGDFDNDTENELVVADSGKLTFVGHNRTTSFPHGSTSPTAIHSFDYDNDGWLDIVLGSETGLRLWRNLGDGGFEERSSLLPAIEGEVRSIQTADFDRDGDSDLLIDLEESGLRLLRNNGGNANRMLTLRLTGTRSNTSGIGTRVVLAAGTWHTSRTLRSRPFEVGVRQHPEVDSLSIHWTDVIFNVADVDTSSHDPLVVEEVALPTGSCPNLYAWDGSRFRYVTDILGASPAGLRITDNRFIPADTDEFVRLGGSSDFPPMDGFYRLHITDELREIIYLDEVKLFAADHPSGTEVVPTSKLLPSGPFPPHLLRTLSDPVPPVHAIRSDGLDVTGALSEVDEIRASPVSQRVAQLRGLAEPYAITLDFGPIPEDQPIALGITAWLRFGGGMANVAASHHPDLPFPFPQLEARNETGQWQPVDVVMGAPAGKTKHILVDLTDRLPSGTRELRITTAFEIHWDRIALFQLDPEAPVTHSLTPRKADLHWHGFGQYEDRPWSHPLTPVFDEVNQKAPWRIQPSGWVTRYGDVAELLERKDDALAILASGDGLELHFPAGGFPPVPTGMTRTFFLFSSGWDKDSDYHVESGNTVEPLPYHGMDDQLYGPNLPPGPDRSWWIEKYNRRWIAPLTMNRGIPDQDGG